MENFLINKEHVFIIAELSANHNGNLDVAVETIRAAARAGANAIKLQTYTADTLTLNSDKEDFRFKGTIWEGKNLYQLYQEAYTPWEWHEQLFQVAQEEGLSCFSSPFDLSAVDFLENLQTPAYKIASFEITDIPLIRYAASKMKPMIISTGIAELEDIELALKTCRDVGNHDITLLKCTSSYPASIELANLKTIPDMAQRFGVKVGLSDHSMGNTVPVVATSLGACMIEKHFILDKKLGGPDAAFSLNPEEFGSMVQAVREAEKALGEISYTLNEKTKGSRAFARSLYVIRDIKKGELLTKENLASIRPGHGAHPKFLPEFLGKKVNRDLEKGDAFHSDYIL